MTSIDKILTPIVNKIKSWDDWAEIEKTVFDQQHWIKTPNEEKLTILPDLLLGGSIWHKQNNNYQNIILYSLYEKLSLMVFAKLEPDAHKNNLLHPEHYGVECANCLMWTRDHKFTRCPRCGGDLIWRPLNEHWDK
jgi:hypothetical protein